MNKPKENQVDERGENKDETSGRGKKKGRFLGLGRGRLTRLS